MWSSSSRLCAFWSLHQHQILSSIERRPTVNIKYSNPHYALISKAKLLNSEVQLSEWGLRYNIRTYEILGGCNIHIQKIKQIPQQTTRPNLLNKFIAIVENLRYCTYLTSSFSCHERIAVNSEVSRNDYHQWIGELLADDGVIEWNTPKLKCWTRKFEGLLLHQSPQIVLHFSPWRLLTAIDCEYMKIVHKTSNPPFSCDFQNGTATANVQDLAPTWPL